MNLFPSRRFTQLRVPAIHALHGLCLLLGFTLLVSTSSECQYATIRPMSDNVSRIDVRGTVINSVTGEPIPRALVTLGGREAHSMLTESDGGFTFEKVPAENIYLQARRPGFFDRMSIFVQPEKAKNIVVKMSPAGLIYGQVLDENGEAVESAQVRLLQERMIAGKSKWLSVNAGQTNDQGRYRLPNLRPGKYIVAAGPGMNQFGEIGKTGYSKVFYPKAPDVASATPIQVSAGDQVEADFELSRVPVFKVSGVVAGSTTRGINVFLTDASGSEIGVFARHAQATGEFEIRSVPRGTYMIRAQGFIDEGEPLSAQALVTVNGDVSGIALLLHPPIVIPVEIRTDSQQPTGASERPPSFVNIVAVSTTDEANGYANFDGPPENRREALHIPQSGIYNLAVNPAGDGYVRSAISGNTDLLEDPLIVPTSGRVDPIQVVLASDGATVRGVVRDSTGGVIIVAVPESERRQPASTGCGPQGQFSFQSLAPGDYSLYAIRGSDGMDYTDRNSIVPFRSKGTHVTLAPNQTSEVTLDLIETEQ